MQRSRIVEVVEEIVRLVMPRDPCHGIDHVMRVRDLALRIAREMGGVDLELVELAALLHDIARHVDEKRHAELSARFARILLELAGLDRERIEIVAQAIEDHSFSSGRRPRNAVGAVLSDADKLDAMGAIGVARVFSYGGSRGRSIEESLKHFEEKILKLKNLLITEPGKRIGEERHRVVEEFLARLRSELSSTR